MARRGEAKAAAELFGGRDCVQRPVAQHGEAARSRLCHRGGGAASDGVGLKQVHRELHHAAPIRRRAAALIRSKGDQQLTVEELTSEIQPHGRATVPDEVKADLLQRIRRFVEEQGA